MSGNGGFAHVELAFSDGECFSSSSRDGGCRFKAIDIHDSESWALVNVRATAEQEAAARAFCRAQNGKPYDWLGVFGFILPIRQFDHPGRRWFCSEVVCAALQAAGDPLHTDPLSTSPNDLYPLAVR